MVLRERDHSIFVVLLNELVETITKGFFVFISATAEGVELSTAKQRSNFRLVMPVQRTVDSSGHTAGYIPIPEILQTMIKIKFKKPNHCHLECICLMKMEHTYCISKKNSYY